MEKTRSVINRIQKCTDCPLHNNQTPLMDNRTSADVMWVGLSAVKVGCTKKESPLSNKTNTGKLIAEIESRVSKTDFYKTNLVKCLPLKDEKIRYPKQDEMMSCSRHLNSELIQFKPKVVFLLGKQVSDFVSDDKEIKLSDSFKYKSFLKNNTIYVPVHHPSYILVYKRSKLNSYINGIAKIIRQYEA